MTTRLRVFLDSNVLISALIGDPDSAPKDASIVAAAVRSGATHFVTGDKRLIAEMERNAIGSPLPVTPRQMLDLLLQSTGHHP